MIHAWLREEPSGKPPEIQETRYLVIDGTYLHKRDLSAVVVINGVTHQLIHGEYDCLENSPQHVIRLLHRLKRQGLNPYSVTLDGNPKMMSALKQLWPAILLQRCLVHVQRQGLMWCRRHPKRPDARRLRELFLRIPLVKTPAQRDTFLQDVQAWEGRYGCNIAHSSVGGWVFSDLQRARSMLLKALPDMFHFMKCESIPSTTNVAESYFSRLKMLYRRHRGLPSKRQSQYFNWYFHLCRK
jgi:transposase-like protein